MQIKRTRKPLYLNIYVLFFSFFILPELNAQSFSGTWMVEKVSAEGQEMTPDGRWTRFDTLGNYYSGNGGYQHSKGTYRLDTVNKWIELKELYGIEEPFGPFSYQLDGDRMIWKRMEEGMMITVVMKRITELPSSNADKVIGLWGISSMTKDGKDVSEEYLPLSKNSIFLRWDRVYIQRWATGSRANGYYQVHAHRPEITIITVQKDYVQVRKWRIEFIGDTEIMLHGADKENEGISMHLHRIFQFPE